jgi:hypothetical protein
MAVLFAFGALAEERGWLDPPPAWLPRTCLRAGSTLERCRAGLRQPGPTPDTEPGVERAYPLQIRHPNTDMQRSLDSSFRRFSSVQTDGEATIGSKCARSAVPPTP